MVIHSVPTLIQTFYPNRIWKKNEVGETVYLTFDDGPVQGVTDFVLNELEKRGMKATFFMVGANVKKNPLIAKEVLLTGNGIGNHTFHHINGWKTKAEDYLSDFRACDQIIEETLNFTPRLFRPPYGKMTQPQAKVIRESHELIMWNVLSGDYDRGLTADEVVKNTVRRLNSGAIVVLHDQEKTRDTIKKVLPDLLDSILEKGFQTATL
jgi:peptidoglycan-N-acetylglucosamine deacetylase